MSVSGFDQGDWEQPISVMTHGMNELENDRRTFGGSDRTPGLGPEDTPGTAEDVTVDEMLTCTEEKPVRLNERKDGGGRTRESPEPAVYSISSTTSSSVGSLDSSSPSASAAARLVMVVLTELMSPDGLLKASWRGLG